MGNTSTDDSHPHTDHTTQQMSHKEKEEEEEEVEETFLQEDEDMSEGLGSLSWFNEELKEEDAWSMQDDQDNWDMGSMTWFDEMELVSMQIFLDHRFNLSTTHHTENTNRKPSIRMRRMTPQCQVFRIRTKRSSMRTPIPPFQNSRLLRCQWIYDITTMSMMTLYMTTTICFRKKMCSLMMFDNQKKQSFSFQE